VNAVYYNKIQEQPEADRPAYVQKLRDEYRADVDIYKLASELVVDEIIPGDDLRGELEKRFALYSQRFSPRPHKKHGVLPV
jgi:acetyl-CoA carboxylase carboxyltransferase component